MSIESGEVVGQEVVGHVFISQKPDGSGDFAEALVYREFIRRDGQIHVAQDGTERPFIAEEIKILYGEDVE